MKKISEWLDSLALLSWGLLLLKYSLTGELKLLVHPNYFWLITITGVIFILLTIIKTWQIVNQRWVKLQNANTSVQHISLLPSGFGSGLLVMTAVLGLLIPPRILSSDTALQRGVTEALPVTRVQTQEFRTSTLPQDRSIVDWVRTLNAYPEPTAYLGQPVKVSGFVIHLKNLDDNYILLSRFIITCCAVDAYPVGIPVKLNGSKSLYPPDSWLEVEGEMITEIIGVDTNTLSANASGKRQVVIQAKSVKKIPTPSDPYGYQ